LIISIITFFATSLKSPQQLAQDSLGRYITLPQERAFIYAHGLNRPVLERYFLWLGAFLRGDFGTSVITNRPVRADVLPRLERTLILATVTLSIAVPVGVGLGAWSARRWGTATDLSLNIGAVVVSALPEFVIGLLLLLLFSVKLGWLPVDSGEGIAFGSFADQARAYVLPVATLFLASVPFMLRTSRSAIREALATPYVRAAVLRGLSRRRILWVHAMRNAATPIINAAALNLVYLLGGVIVVETLFGFPGLGQGLVAAVSNGDTITVQAIALILGAMFIAISMGADLLAVFLNPTLRGAR